MREILIKIPDEIYQSVIDGTYCGSLYKEIKNGTPLPEHHGRLIEEKELSNHLKECLFETALNNMGYKIECHKVFEDIADNRIDIWIKDAHAIIEGSDSE